MNHRLFLPIIVIALLLPTRAFAQDPTGTIEGVVTDGSASVVARAHVTVKNLDTGFTRDTQTGADGFYRLTSVPIGQYSVAVEASQFAPLVRQPVIVSVGQAVRVDSQVAVQRLAESLTVAATVPLVDSSTTALGHVVTGRELLDLPLNGRNFTQLGLLQTGVAPLTAGVATAGGSLR